eukprot:CAMPEP_0195303084 /NCGR_PEP_ID=MMETSP0707-20130614/32216_1 /TAXON_ID=33640 /ORGANISM="Asterionellopsis glacialis, Strain CCMP134" /LENGTH=765 /DNA_ID=CAMNT_0040366531 /DNA_START=148 /DNA_END=2445 /DNA_ORIENTATION=-
MELPFAVDSPDRQSSNNNNHHPNHDHNNPNLHASNVSSLETASSQGSLFMSNPNNNSNNHHNIPNSSGQQLQPKADITEQIDFTYVTVGELDSDEVDVVIGGELRTPHGNDPSASPAGGGGCGDYYGDTEDSKMPPGNMLSVLLRSETSILMTMGMPESNNNESSSAYIYQCEDANKAAQQALHSKEQGNLEAALQAHSEAAKLFLQASESVRRDVNSNTINNNNTTAAQSSMALQKSLLMSSQSQARAALALKRVIKRPFDVTLVNKKSSTNDTNASSAKSMSGIEGGRGKSDDTHTKQQNPTTLSGTTTTNKDNHSDRIRATVRGALWTRNEEDLSESQFLGRATTTPNNSKSSQRQHPQSSSAATRNSHEASSSITNANSSSSLQQSQNKTAATTNSYINPVDDMMELEKELRNMDMALELGNSIASLNHHRSNSNKASPPHSMEDGSFCVVPTSSWAGASGMGSTMLSKPHHGAAALTSSPNHHQHQNIRARANRVQPSSTATSHRTLIHSTSPFPPATASTTPTTNGLESSWWGNASTTAASQILSSSILSSTEPLHHHHHVSTMDGHQHSHGGSGGGGHNHNQQQQQATNNKQVMNLLDSLRTLSEENATLLRELESAEAARAEAKAAKETMRRFKAQYEQRFAELRKALEKFKGSGGPNNGSGPNPVTDSTYVRTASISREAQEKENLIRRLTIDLKKEKEDSSKKDAALRKYESFYREVKARSAQKAAQKQRQLASQKRQKNAATAAPRLPPPRSPR